MGDRAVLIAATSADDRERVMHLLHRSRDALGRGITIRPGMATVLVEGTHPDAGLRERVVAALRSSHGDASGAETSSRAHALPVRYIGVDLEEVAAALDVTVDDLVSAHQAQQWRVAMLGFAPGFAYLEPVGDEVLRWSDLGRRDSPRARVPRGSVALAAGMSAVYPQDMPGGWHLIGECDVTLFDISRPEDPALLRAGDSVRFGGEPL